MAGRISSLRLFACVAHSGSFTAASKEAGLSQPSVSRIIAKLENDLGVALFVRSTHAVTLTEAGANYLARIEPILVALEEADHEVRGTGELRGHLKIGAPTSFAIRELIPRLPPFLQQHPSLHLDLILTDSRQDLISEAIDVALRFGAPLSDSALVARKLGTSRRLLAASPGYLAKAGTPKVPADLVEHQVIVGPSGANPAGWVFQKNGATTSVRVVSRIRVTVNEASTSAALTDMGIISTAFLGCKAELESGTLVQLLPDWEIGSVELNAVLAGGRAAKPSARAFTDYLASSFLQLDR